MLIRIPFDSSKEIFKIQFKINHCLIVVPLLFAEGGFLFYQSLFLLNSLFTVLQIPNGFSFFNSAGSNALLQF